MFTYSRHLMLRAAVYCHLIRPNYATSERSKPKTGIPPCLGYILTSWVTQCAKWVPSYRLTLAKVCCPLGLCVGDEEGCVVDEYIRCWTLDRSSQVIMLTHSLNIDILRVLGPLLNKLYHDHLFIGLPTDFYTLFSHISGITCKQFLKVISISLHLGLKCISTWNTH